MNNPAQIGHDAPVTDRSDDFYDRWPIAKSISRIIETAPPQWSTRIGLFGPWGDGKTSVLNFLEQQQRTAANIVIRYAPWGATTPDEVWRDFGKVLIAGLARHNVKLTMWSQIVNRTKSVDPKTIKTGVNAVGKLVEASGHAPGAAMGANFASTLIGDKLTFTSEDIQRLTKQLGNRRVVVFIDDLDRTEAAVIPKLLLVLRELLDFAQFAFVLAFDRDIVAAALEAGNQSWGKSGQSFLDKVIDFRVELPSPTADQVRRLGLDQFGRLCPFVPKESVEAIAKLLPTNPRKLKLLARMIASTKEEVGRHEADELEWGVILLLALIRTESEGFAGKLLAITVDGEEYNWIADLDPNQSKEEKQKEQLDKLLKQFPELDARKGRIELLVEAWREEVPTIPGERIRYQAMFALSPHCITWGEFKQFFAKWRANKQSGLVTQFLGERVSASEARPESVQSEMSETIISHYETVLESASNAKAKADHLALMNEGSDALDLLIQCLTGNPRLCAISAEQGLARWEALYGIAMRWRHFNANDHEPELRAKEVQTLLTFGEAIGTPMLIYEKLDPTKVQDSFLGEREAILRTEMCETLRTAFEPTARAVALTYVATPGNIKKLRARDKKQAARFLLTSPHSPMFAGHKEELMTTLEARRNTAHVVEDASDYLSLLSSALVHGDGGLCTADERKTFITAHPDFMRLIWSLCVSEPSQFRMLQGLRDQRKVLVAAGMPDADLVEPEWLKPKIVN